MITTLALSAAIDVTYLVDELRVGDITVPTDVIRSAGGKALNVARAAHALGSPVASIAVLGGHSGDLAASLLPSTIDLRVVRTPAETRTCVSIASSTDAALTELYERAAPIDSVAWGEVAHAVARVESGWLVVSGSIPSGCDGLVDLLAARVEAGVSVAVDSHGAALEAILAGVQVALVKINRSEAVALLGCSPDLAIESLAALVRERTRGLVVITDGTNGSCAATEHGQYRVLPDSQLGRFPVGSGDCFLGALLYGLDDGMPIDEALRLAAAAGSANALRPGAASFDVDDVASARDRIRVEGPQ
ncbi:MAG: 1-phosphofructokinase family hexose kinase [Rhodoglobus sp.]